MLKETKWAVRGDKAMKRRRHSFQLLVAYVGECLILPINIRSGTISTLGETKLGR